MYDPPPVVILTNKLTPAGLFGCGAIFVYDSLFAVSAPMNSPDIFTVEPATLLTYIAVPSPLSIARLGTIPVASSTVMLVSPPNTLVVTKGVMYSPPPALVSIILVT